MVEFAQREPQAVLSSSTRYLQVQGKIANSLCVSPVSYTRRGLCANVLQEKRGTTQTTIYLAARSCLVRYCRLSSTIMKSDPGSNDRIHSGHGRRRYRNERQGRTAATLLGRLKPPESPQLLCRCQSIAASLSPCGGVVDRPSLSGALCKAVQFCSVRSTTALLISLCASTRRNLLRLIPSLAAVPCL